MNWFPLCNYTHYSLLKGFSKPLSLAKKCKENGFAACGIAPADAAPETAERLRKRAGHLLSKMRYVSAQLLAYIDNGLWLNLAGHANARAAEFAAAMLETYLQRRLR